MFGGLVLFSLNAILLRTVLSLVKGAVSCGIQVGLSLFLLYSPSEFVSVSLTMVGMTYEGKIDYNFRCGENAVFVFADGTRFVGNLGKRFQY